MNTKFILNVDVPGEMGGNTIIDNRFNPNKVYHLHLVFDQYPDDIFKCSPVYIVSESLYNSVIDLGLSGLHNARLISYSLNDNHYQTIQHDGKIPTQNYFMVDINENGEEDFSLIRINDLIRLCVSDRAFRLLSSFNIDNADIS